MLLLLLEIVLVIVFFEILRGNIFDVALDVRNVSKSLSIQGHFSILKRTKNLRAAKSGE
jgi:hypothetical protein